MKMRVQDGLAHACSLFEPKLNPAIVGSDADSAARTFAPKRFGGLTGR